VHPSTSRLLTIFGMYLALISIISFGVLFHFGIFRRATQAYDEYGMQTAKVKNDFFERQCLARNVWF